MKGKINADGNLELLRKNAWRIVHCPNRFDLFCGDHCALFGEPEIITHTVPLLALATEEITLSLCLKTLHFSVEGFKDERVK